MVSSMAARLAQYCLCAAHMYEHSKRVIHSAVSSFTGWHLVVIMQQCSMSAPKTEHHTFVRVKLLFLWHEEAAYLLTCVAMLRNEACKSTQ